MVKCHVCGENDAKQQCKLCSSPMCPWCRVGDQCMLCASGVENASQERYSNVNSEMRRIVDATQTTAQVAAGFGGMATGCIQILVSISMIVLVWMFCG